MEWLTRNLFTASQLAVFVSVTVAGYSVVHFLVNVPHEARTTVPQLAVVSQQDDNSPCAVGLKSLLSHLNVVTDANLFDCHGRTPLMCAIIDGCKAAACQLVCCSFIFNLFSILC